MSKIIDNEEYISIKEFAAAIGYTPQGVYKKINNPLNPLHDLVKTVKGVSYLPKSSISVISAATVIEKTENDLNNDLNNTNDNLNAFNTEETEIPAIEEDKKQEENTDITKEIIEMLKAELEQKNKQIEELNKRLEETTKALHQAQELTHREQELNAKNILMLESQEQKKKKGIFKRIFKGKDNE